MMTVGDLIVVLTAGVSRTLRRRRQRRVGRATPVEARLYAVQRRQDLPQGHPYAR